MPRRDFDRAKRELDAIEAELTTQLCAELKKVSKGYNTLLFITSDHNPRNYPEHWRSKSSDRLLNLARESLELRRLLVLPTNRCVGQLFVAACDESADTNDENRLGPIRLAARLLSDIEELKRTDT